MNAATVDDDSAPNDTTMDTTEDRLDASGPPSPHGQRSQLSIEDLSAADEETKCGNSTTRPIFSDAEASSRGRSTGRVEEKLQRNLRLQQEHYARQRKLFEDLRRDADLVHSPSICSSSSRSSDAAVARTRHYASIEARSTDPAPSRSGKFHLDLQQKGCRRDDIRTMVKQSPDSECETERRILQCRAKDIADYHTRITVTDTQRKSKIRTSGHSDKRSKSTLPNRLYEGPDPSNEALRKQLELLRRLQLDNNKFRNENRSLREQNDALEEQNALQSREVKRMRDEINDLNMRVQHDQVQLANAAQNNRKLKQCQKQLTIAQTEKDKLQFELQEALDQDEQNRRRAEGDLDSVVQEAKHFKRAINQLRHRETQLVAEKEALVSAMDDLENAHNELQRRFLEIQQESGELATRLTEKTTQIQAVETSASSCVERMEAGMEALQKAHTSEREKRKKVEQARDTLQAQLDSLDSEVHSLRAQLVQAEHVNTQLKSRLQEGKLERRLLKKVQEDKDCEYQERRESDSKTIASLRDERATFEQQIGAMKTSLVDLRQEVAVESNALRKDVEALRHYAEDALHGAPSSNNNSRLGISGTGTDGNTDADAASVVAPVMTRQRREELWVQLPELQFLQGAVGGLRNELMNLVNDFHRGQHGLRQQNRKLTRAQERITEMERLNSEDAARIRELTAQRVLSDEARDITSKEKLEILKWSQQTCERNESLERVGKRCEECIERVHRKLHHVLTPTMARCNGGDSDGGADTSSTKANSTAASCSTGITDETQIKKMLATLERDANALVSKYEQTQDELLTVSLEREENSDRVARLERDMEHKRHEFEVTIEDVEQLHERHMAEKQTAFDATLKSIEAERELLAAALREEQVSRANETDENERLQAAVAKLEADIPVWAAVLEVFKMVVPPLVLQVSELLAQKRFLVRINFDYEQSHEQMECIGEVLKELMPAARKRSRDGTSESRSKRLQRLRSRFRFVVIAVFALNRFRRGAPASSECQNHFPKADSIFGVCSSLKPTIKSRKKNTIAVSSFSTSQPPRTVIKTRPRTSTLSETGLRELIERLLRTDLVSVVTSVETTNTKLGPLVLQILGAIDPEVNDSLLEQTEGVFHCKALLHRCERKPNQYTNHHETQRHSSNTDTTTANHYADGEISDGGELRTIDGNHPSVDNEAGISTIDLIRKRILAMGKRVEDLHYQRNSLQKENYELQFQLEQQYAQLQEMDAVAATAEQSRHQLSEMQSKTEQQLAQAESTIREKNTELAQRATELVAKHGEIERVQKELAHMVARASVLEQEKSTTAQELMRLQELTLESEEKARKSHLTIERHSEEVRHLKQAARKAHELHQKATWQLEQELIEKANLNAMVEHLRRQKETLEREIHSIQLRTVAHSFSSDSGREDSFSGDHEHAHSSSTNIQGVRKQEPHVAPSVTDQNIKANRERNARYVTFDSDHHTVNETSDQKGGAAKGDDGKPSQHNGWNSYDDFRAEWKRLDICSAFADEDASNDKSGDDEDESACEGLSSGSQRSTRSPKLRYSQHKHYHRQKDNAVLSSEVTRRRVEIDKVNTAVHDYMDRIDDKLQQMYGIPPSSNRHQLDPPQSPVGTASLGHAGTREDPLVRNAFNPKSPQGVNASKASEVRLEDHLDEY